MRYLVFLLLWLLYVILAWFTAGGKEWHQLALVDGASLFFIDDAYRYFIAREVFTNADLFSWSYALPVWLLLEGGLSLLLNENLYAMRLAHGVIGLATLALCLDSAIRIGADKSIAMASCLIVGLMPLYIFVSLSFYGALWLAFLFAAGMNTLIRGQKIASVICFALLPLIRPEGLLFLVPGAISLFLKRSDRKYLLLLLGPGIFYGIYLVLVLFPDVWRYFNWRTEIRFLLLDVFPEMQMGLSWSVGLGRFISTFNFFWIVVAVYGLWLPALRPYWPVWSGAVLWTVLLLLYTYLGLIAYEARYLYSLLPALVIGFAVGMTHLRRKLALYISSQGAKAVMLAAVVAIIFEHVLQIDPLKAIAGDRRWPVAGVPAQFQTHEKVTTRELVQRQSIGDSILRLLEENPGIDTVLMQHYMIFYHLDPKKVPSHVRVVYVPAHVLEALMMGGVFWGMHPGGKQFGYYLLRGNPADGEGQALFVGDLSIARWIPAVREGDYRVHHVGYSLQARPTVFPGKDLLEH